MKITGIRVHRVELPLREGSYKWSGGNEVRVFDSTIVELITDEGVSGWGEACPLGSAYLPAYAAGVRAGLAELAPHLLGQDPTAIGPLNLRMDTVLRGHPYVKSAVDVACWDILGRVTGRPVVDLLGGRYGEDVMLYRAISQDQPDAMAERVAAYRAEGYTRFQLKVGGDPDTDVLRMRAAARALLPGDLLVGDANTGWTRLAAARVADQVRDLDIIIEQPCATYEECLSIRRRTAKPFVLDEVIDSTAAVIRAAADDAMDGVNLKISRLGGLTKARAMRDLCASLGVAMTIEDTWGSDIGTAAIAHLAHSTPPALLFAATDFNSYVTVATATGTPARVNGRMAAPSRPGLGVEPIRAALGPPVAVYP